MHSSVIICYLIILFGSYFMGSIPFSFIGLKAITGEDIRKVGDKNVGAGNAYRHSKSIMAGLIALSGDIAKGALVVSLTSFLIYAQDLNLQVAFSVAAFGVITGHNYSIFLKFNGGKGYATGIGFFASINVLATIFQFIFYKSFHESTKNLIKSKHESFFTLILSIIFSIILVYLTTPVFVPVFISGFLALIIKQTYEHYFKN